MAAGSKVVLETPDTQSLMPGRLNGCLGDAGHSVIDALLVVLAKQSHCTIIFPALYHATAPHHQASPCCQRSATT
jgi:hypothetical protein